MIIDRLGLVATLVGFVALLPVACGSSLNGADAGSSGTVGTGMGGGSGTGGAAGGTTSPLPAPTCLRDLISNCRLTAACGYTRADGGTELCYSNGVKAVSVVNSGAPGWVSNIYSADGTLCYSEEVSCDSFCESHYVVWKNAAGERVATAQLDASFVGASGQVAAQSKVSCVATAETCLSAIGDTESCLPLMVNENRCTQDVCP